MKAARGRLIAVIALALVAVGAGAAYLNSSYWAAHRIGDAEIRYLNLARLKESLGGQPAIKIPGPASKTAFRLEKNVSLSSLLPTMGDPQLAQTLELLRSTEESGPLVLGEAADQAIATFGRGIVEAGFHVPSGVLDDWQSAVWARVNPPFHGSIYGVHLGEPWVKAEAELRRRGAVTATGLLAGGHLMSISEMAPVRVDWLVEIACNENDANRPVTRITTWQTAYRSVKIKK